MTTRIFNLFYREYWREIYDDTHMGTYSRVEKAIAGMTALIEANRQVKGTPEHPFRAWLIVEEDIDPDPNTVSEHIEIVADKDGNIFFRRGQEGCDRIVPPEYETVDFPSIAGN